MTGRQRLAILLVLACVTAGCAAVLAAPGSRPAGRHAGDLRRRSGMPGRRVVFAPGRHPVPPIRATRPPAAPATRPSGGGRLLVRVIPGTASGFAARPALIYLPPAARTAPTERFPVIELMGGVPGTPMQWVTKGGIVAIANSFAARHQGRAPIVVVPDNNGRYLGDTECVDSARGNAETYLVDDVPRYLLSHFPASADRRQWAIAGNSEGGMCATLLALRNPAAFGLFVDLSGLTRPTVRERDARAATTAGLFGGSRASFDRHDPLWLLAHHTYSGLTGLFECGSRDVQVVRAQLALARAARAAGVAVAGDIVPGGHTWILWRWILARVFPWIWQTLTR